MKNYFLIFLLLLAAGCAFTPEPRISGTDGEWWDNHKNRKVF